MANATPNRVGQINGAGDADALFLKLFGGEVLTAFETTKVALDYTTVRTINNGKSAAFPTFGTVAAAYHVPGAELLGTASNGGEVVISVDGMLVAHQYVSEIDELKAHWDARSPVSYALGEALATQMDAHILQMGVLAARASNVVTGQPGGSVILTNDAQAPASANFNTNGDHLAEALFIAAQKLDEKEVPKNDRVAFVRPAQFYNLVKATKTVNKDFGGMGSYAEGEIIKVAGITIVATPYLPNTDLSAVTDVRAGTDNKYRGNFANTSALVMQKTALGTVKLKDLTTEATWDPRRLATLMTARYAVGHGVLRPQAAVEIRNAAV